MPMSTSSTAAAFLSVRLPSATRDRLKAAAASRGETVQGAGVLHGEDVRGAQHVLQPLGGVREVADGGAHDDHGAGAAPSGAVLGRCLLVAAG